MKQGRDNSAHIGKAISNGLTENSLRKNESLRQQYLPDPVRILFVGEAPPASGRFFYRGDSGLYRAVRETFMTAFPAMAEDDFLNAFRLLGCYLVDLCSQPVDHLPRGIRMSTCRDGEVGLAQTIRSLQPMVIVTLVKSIRSNVERARSLAGWSGLHLEVPYPGRWKQHRVEFERLMLPVLLETLPMSAISSGKVLS